MPPETAAACVYNAVSFIHGPLISQNKVTAYQKKEEEEIWDGAAPGEWQREEWQ